MEKTGIIKSLDGKAWLRKTGNINVLHLQGTTQEMAMQHVQLLTKESREGLLPFMAEYLVGHVKHQQTGLEQLLTRGLVEGICRKVASGMPAQELRAFHAISKLIHMTPTQIDVALGSADTLLILFALGEKIASFGMRAGIARALPFACSGAIALPGVTTDNHLWHGRNLDYDGLGYWDDHHVIAFLKPNHGQPYGFVSTAGIHTAGLTAFNASGIVAAVNTSPTLDCSWNGEPVFGVMDRLIRQSRTLEQAVKIAEQAKIASGYNIHISHGPSGTAAVVETSYTRAGTRRPENGTLLVTNHYLDPEMAATIPKHILVDLRNSQARLNRLRALFANKTGIDRDFMASALRDRIGQDGKFHPLGDVVCNLMNLSSIVADVTAGKIWVADGNAPVALGTYQGFDIHWEWDHFGEAPSQPLPAIPAADPGYDRCTFLFQEAHKAMIHHGDREMARTFTQAALKTCPDEPHLLLIAALLSLVNNDINKATDYANAYIQTVPKNDQRLYRVHLLLAWIAQLKKDYTAADTEFSLAMDAAATEHARFEVEWWSKRKPMNIKGLRTFHVDMFNGKRLIF